MNWIKRAWHWLTNDDEKHAFERMMEEQVTLHHQSVWPTHLPNCRCAPIGSARHGIFTDFWAYEISRTAIKMMEANKTPWGAIIPINKEEKVEIKVGDKVKHQSGVEGKIIQAVPPTAGTFTMFPTDKNVFQAPYTGPASEFTKIEDPPKFKKGDRMTFTGTVDEVSKSDPRFVHVKFDGCHARITAMTFDEMSEARHVEPTHTHIYVAELESQMAQWGALGTDQQVTLYSATGAVLRQWVSDGKVSTESGSDGWFFRDRATGKLVRVSGIVVIEAK